MLDLLYGQVARWRRRAFERHPERRRRLARPVISVGNLSVGGTGKTPVVAALARWLIAQGERPAILSRGYGRAERVREVVVVADGLGTTAPLGRAGDEPLMLARAVPGAIVCVAASRHEAGLTAETTLGATVHLLDDGFQHHRLARDLDVLVTTPGEIPGGHVLPRGRLREPRDVAARADVLVVVGADAAAARIEAERVGVVTACGASRTLGPPILLSTESSALSAPDSVLRAPCSSPVVAACGIANPQRFIDDLTVAGWTVARAVTFADHHRFTSADIDRLARAVTESGAVAVVTTDKDAVRFEPLAPWPFALYRVPITIGFDPPDALFACVAATLAAHRRSAVATPSGASRAGGGHA